jgi:hypothetical protein
LDYLLPAAQTLTVKHLVHVATTHDEESWLALPQEQELFPH